MPPVIDKNGSGRLSNEPGTRRLEVGLQLFIQMFGERNGSLLIPFTENGEEADLRSRLKAPALNLTQDLYIADGLKTGRVMVKDEDVCLHCGLCAERCPTGAWDMQKTLIQMKHAGQAAKRASL